MYSELKTTDRQKIINAFVEKLDSGMPTGFVTCRIGDLYCADILDMTEEPEVCGEAVIS